MSGQKVIYSLRHEDIKVGDIVFTSRPGFVPWLIRFFTLSSVSHVAICTKPGFLLEAVPRGVVRRAVFSTHVVRKRWIKVLRPKMELVPNADGLTVEYLAEQKLYYGYSVPGAISTRIPFISFDEDGAVFCSRLVAEAQREYGLDLVPGKPVGKITPGKLTRSRALRNVSKSCVREVDPLVDANLHGLICDTEKAQEQNAPFDEKDRLVFQKIRKSAGINIPANVYSLPELRLWMSESSSEAISSDQCIIQVLHSEQYFVKVNAWLDEVEAKAVELRENAKIIRALSGGVTPTDRRAILDVLGAQECVSDESLAARCSTMEQHTAMAARAPLQTILEFSKLYRREYLVFSAYHAAEREFRQAIEARLQ